jgi:hypothetical protein
MLNGGTVPAWADTVTAWVEGPLEADWFDMAVPVLPCWGFCYAELIPFHQLLATAPSDTPKLLVPTKHEAIVTRN